MASDWMQEALKDALDIVQQSGLQDEEVKKEAAIGGGINFDVSGRSPSMPTMDNNRRRRELEAPEQHDMFRSLKAPVEPRRRIQPKQEMATPATTTEAPQPDQFNSKFNKFLNHLKNLSPFKKKEQPQADVPAKEVPQATSVAPTKSEPPQMEMDFSAPKSNPVQERLRGYNDQIRNLREKELGETPEVRVKQYQDQIQKMRQQYGLDAPVQPAAQSPEAKPAAVKPKQTKRVQRDLQHAINDAHEQSAKGVPSGIARDKETGGYNVVPADQAEHVVNTKTQPVAPAATNKRAPQQAPRVTTPATSPQIPEQTTNKTSPYGEAGQKSLQEALNPKNDIDARERHYRDLAKHIVENNVPAQQWMKDVPGPFQRGVADAIKESQQPAPQSTTEPTSEAPMATEPQTATPAPSAVPARSTRSRKPAASTPTTAPQPEQEMPTAQQPAADAAPAEPKPTRAPRMQKQPQPAPQPQQTPAALSPAGTQMRQFLADPEIGEEEKTKTLSDLMNHVKSGRLPQEKFDAIVPPEAQHLVQNMNAPTQPQSYAEAPQELQNLTEQVNNPKNLGSARNSYARALAQKMQQMGVNGDEWKSWVDPTYHDAINRELNGGKAQERGQNEGKRGPRAGTTEYAKRETGEPAPLQVSQEHAADLGQAPGEMPSHVKNALDAMFGRVKGATQQIKDEKGGSGTGADAASAFTSADAKVMEPLFNTIWTSPNNEERASALGKLIDHAGYLSADDNQARALIPPDMHKLYDQLSSAAENTETNYVKPRKPRAKVTDKVAATINRIEDLISITSHLQSNDFELLTIAFLEDGYEPEEIAKVYEYHYTDRL